MWLVLFWLYGRYLNLSQGKAGNRMLSLFLAFWTLFDRAMLLKDGSTKLLWANHTQVFKSLLCLIGLYVMWMALLGFLETFLLSHSHSKPAVFRHPFGTPFLMILSSYLFCGIIRYPGVLLWDTYFQLCEFFGDRAFLAMNPPVHTVFCGWFVQLGNLFGKPQLGLYLMMLLQVAALSFVCAYFVKMLQHWHAPAWLVWTMILLPAFSPLYISYATTVSKDSAYAASILLFLIQTAVWVLERDSFRLWTRQGIRNWTMWIVAAVLSIWTRKNGVYVVGLTSAGMIITALHGKKKIRERIIPAVCAAVVLVTGLGVEGYIRRVYNVGKGSVREVLSLPFQQTALVLREQVDQIPQEEWQAIDRVLEADAIDKVYLSYISDPVKSTYRENSTLRDLTGYFKVWLQQMVRYPDLYLDGMMGMIHHLFSPLSGSVNYEMHSVVGTVNEWDVTEWYTEQPFFQWQEVLYRLWQVLGSWPVIGLTVNLAVFSDGLLALLLFAFRKRIKGFFLCAFPVLLALLFLVFSPVCYTRYALPLYYGLPVLLSLYVVFPGKDAEGSNKTVK